MSNTYTQIHLQLFEVDFDERYIFKQPISHGPSDDIWWQVVGKVKTVCFRCSKKLCV